MADEVVRAPVIGKLLWRGRRLLITLALLGAGLGALAWFALPQSFTSTTKVLLQGTSEESGVATAAEIAMGRTVVQRAVTGLSWEPKSVDEDAVTALASQGNVITISATADTATRAHALAARVAEEYIKFTTAVSGRAAEAATEALSDRREALQREIDELGGSGGDDPTSSRRTELLQALQGLDEQVAQARTEAAIGAASVQVIEPAAVPETSSTPTLPIMIAGGAALAIVVGAAAVAAPRLADRRLRKRADIASALGAPVLGTVAAVPDTDDAADGRWPPLRWLLGAGSSASTPEPTGDRQLELLRYSRVLERLYGVSDGPLRITVVTAEDDSTATRAVARLASAADAAGRPVALLGDSRALAAALNEGPAERPEQPGPPAGTDSPGNGQPPGHPYDAALQVVAVPAARPTVPRDSTTSGALIVTTSGTRTNWELLAVAEACRDAMMPVLGALVVVPIGEEQDVEAGSRMVPSEPATPTGGRMNGHLNGSKP